MTRPSNQKPLLCSPTAPVLPPWKPLPHQHERVFPIPSRTGGLLLPHRHDSIKGIFFFLVSPPALSRLCFAPRRVDSKVFGTAPPPARSFMRGQLDLVFLCSIPQLQMWAIRRAIFFFVVLGSPLPPCSGAGCVRLSPTPHLIVFARWFAPN